jgi:hypothetical protein
MHFLHIFFPRAHGLHAHVFFPSILLVAESFGPAGGAVIVSVTAIVWIGVFVLTLQKVGM